MANVLESGRIYFLYQPRVQHEEVASLDDVQRFHIVLSPRGKRVWRLLTIGRKHMPGIGDGGERLWGFVEKVADDPRAVEDEMDRHVYSTKTRGERVQGPARPAGQGVYAIVDHGGHTHLAYELELPDAPGEVQRELAIEEKGSYVVTVKNPEAPSPPRAGLRGEQKAELLKRLRERFRGRRFAELTPDFLDREGTELVWIGAKRTPEEELDIELDARDQREAETAIFEDLKLERDQHPLEPLFEGEWK